MPETGMAGDKESTPPIPPKAPNPVLLPKHNNTNPSPTSSIIETSSALIASVSSALRSSNSIASLSSSLAAFPDLRALLLTPTSPTDPSMLLQSVGSSQFASLNLFEEPEGYDTGFELGITLPILQSSFSSSAGTPELRHSLTDSLTNEGGRRYLDASSTSTTTFLNDFLDDATSINEDLTDDEWEGNDGRVSMAEAVDLHDLLISKRSLSSLGQSCMDGGGGGGGGGGVRGVWVEDTDRDTLFSDEDEFQLFV
ncbi:hypothetical protein HDU81_008229 [Chytriomyces hyalinus]|nr:hypothetical protein HDU81_008229 [Chytriomyces hyalinus]